MIRLSASQWMILRAFISSWKKCARTLRAQNWNKRKTDKWTHRNSYKRRIQLQNIIATAPHAMHSLPHIFRNFYDWTRTNFRAFSASAKERSTHTFFNCDTIYIRICTVRRRAVCAPVWHIKLNSLLRERKRVYTLLFRRELWLPKYIQRINEKKARRMRELGSVCSLDSVVILHEN